MPLPQLYAKRYKLNATRGFSLIELLVVIAIIGILLAVASVFYTQAQKKGRDAKRKADLKSVQQALELYYETNRKYPYYTIAAPQGRIQCNITGIDTTINNWGQAFDCNSSSGLVTYMKQLPCDPLISSASCPTALVGNYYLFSAFAGIPQTYTFATILENTSDPEASPGCLAINPSYNYCVTNP